MNLTSLNYGRFNRDKEEIAILVDSDPMCPNKLLKNIKEYKRTLKQDIILK